MKKILVVLFSFSFFLSKAQNCPTDLLSGQNLIVNGDFSQDYTGWDFTHDSDNDLTTGPDGYQIFTGNPRSYSIPGNIFVGTGSQMSYFNNAYAPMFNDHSPSTDDKFLMIDGVCVAGIKLWTQTNIPIKPNTNYYFSVWINSLKDNPNYPGIVNFDINGTNIGSNIVAPTLGGGNPSSAGWQKYEVVWNSGSNPSPTATISIEGNQTVGCGGSNGESDFAIDDISFIPGCSYGSAGPQPNLGPDQTLCGLGGSGIVLNANVPQNSTTTITWSDGTTGFGMNAPYTLLVTAPGTYSVCVSDNGSCTKSDVIVITNTFSVNIGPDLQLCDPAAVTLDAGFSGVGVTYKWYKNFPTEADGNNTQRTYYVNTPGTYKVEVTDPSCGTQTAQATITTKAPVATNAVYCNPGNITLSVSPDNSGQYKWWTSPTSTDPADLVAKGTSTYTFAATPTSDYKFYVQDTSSFRVSVGLPLTGNGLTNPQNRSIQSETELTFNVSTTLSIDSVYIDMHIYSCPSGAIQLQVLDASRNVIGTSANFTPSAANGCVTGTSVLFKMPVGITVPAGNGYILKFSNGSNMNWYQTGITYPQSYAGGVVTFAGNSTSYAPQAIPGMYRWVVTAGTACARVPVTATYKSCTPPPPPPTANAGTDFSVCNTNTAQLNATLGTGEAGIWTFATGSSGTVTPPDSPTATVTFTGNSVTMVWNVTNAGGTDRDTVIVSKITVAAPSIIASVSTICADTTGITFTASPDNTGNGSTYQWALLSGDMTLVSGQTTSQLTANAGTAKSIVTLTETNNNCSVTVNDTLNVIPHTPKANAGSDFVACNKTVTLTGMPVAGTWTALTSDPNQVLTQSSPSSATASNLTTGTAYTYMYTITDACGTTRDTVVVTNNAVTAPSIVSIASTCANTTGLTFTASPDNTASGSTYQWTILQGDLTIVSGATTYQLTADAKSAKSIVTLTETNNNCSASVNDTLMILPATPVAYAGTDFATCNTSIALTGKPDLSLGTWTSLTADPNITITQAPQSSTAIASNLSLNTVYEFVYTITGACGTTSDNILVTIGAGGFSIASIIQPADTVCVGSARALTVLINKGSGSFTYSWLKKGTSNSVTTNSPTYTIITTDVSEEYYLYVKDDSTNCTADLDSVNIPSIAYQKLFVPNLITPNGDHSNDEFRIVEVNNHNQNMLPKNSVLKIYNSWGNEIFHSDNYNNDWKAANTGDGVYYYYLKAGCGGEEHKSWLQILGNVNK